MPMHKKHDKGLFLIAILKLLKGASLLAIAIGALHFLHRDMEQLVNHWVDVLNVDPDSRYFRHIIEKLVAIDDRQLKAISAGSFFYSALLLTEGVGLMLEKHWAEYLTIIATASFIPLEIYEIFHHFRWAKIVLLLVNLAIVAYLVWVVKRDRRQGVGK
jgi:uncharacterized membrane protein (DUF2068 family)